jgi:prepilin peptidase CpaA
MKGIYQAMSESPIRRERVLRVDTIWEGQAYLAYGLSLIGLLVLQPEWIQSGMTALFLAWVCFWDWRWHRIPNLITYPTMAVGVAYHALTAGWDGLILGLEGLLLGGGILILAYLFKGIGAGDVKALAALGAVWGPRPIFNIFLISALSGGLVSIGLLVVRGQFIETMRRYWIMTKTFLLTRKFFYIEPSPMMKRVTLPYGVVISCGVAFWYLMGNIT